MTSTDRPPRLARDLHMRTLVRMRWGAVLLGIVQLMAYDAAAWPEPWVRAGVAAVVVALAVVNAALWLAARAATPDRLDALGLVGLVLDVLGASAIVLLLSFDPVSAMFVVLLLPIIEGALLRGLAGAMWTWAATACLYVVREAFAVRFDNPWEWDSLTFRIGLLLLVGYVVGWLVRELVSQQQATAAALAEARRAEAWRARLVSVVAHDLRSPVGAARTGLLLLRDRSADLDPEQSHVVATGVVRQLDRALLLTRDLLDLELLEAGTLRLTTEPVLVADLLQRLVPVLPSGPDVRLDVPDDLVAVLDADRLEQVLHNLVDNAVRHGAAPVVLSASAEGSLLRLRVRDHGPGIPPGVELFRAFAGTGSVGLGGWVVQQLVQAHGGTVVVEPCDPGVEVRVDLPGTVVSGQVAAPVRDRVGTARR